jgi:hypothetical protein
MSAAIEICPVCRHELPAELATMFHENDDPIPDVHICTCGVPLVYEAGKLRRLTEADIADFSADSRNALVRGLLMAGSAWRRGAA